MAGPSEAGPRLDTLWCEEKRALELTAEHVRRGLPRPVGVGIRRRSDAGALRLDADEERVLGVRATEARRASFALGRAAARAALGELGVHAGAIGRGTAGEPLWPTGVVGAISHVGDVAIAVVGRRVDYSGLGLDVEELHRGPSPRAARLVCRPSEMEWVDVAGDTRRLTMIFSAKEAVFKAVYPIERVWLGFADAELTWRPERCAFEARLMKAAGERYPAGFVLEVASTVSETQVLSTTFCAA
ncbi:MAG TPA: 4'-phosphopantetheinyl transferase superfamily protein [Chloroflexota bacterium]